MPWLQISHSEQVEHKRFFSVCVALSKGFDNEGEGEESEEDGVEFVEAGEDSAVSFQAAEEAFDLVCASCTGCGRSSRDRRGWI